MTRLCLTACRERRWCRIAERVLYSVSRSEIGLYDCGRLEVLLSGSTSLAQWFNKYHVGLEVMGSIPMGDFHI